MGSAIAMNPDVPPQSWFNAAVSLLVLSFAFMGKYVWNKVDKIQSSYVTREDLERYLIQLRSDDKDRHTENIDRFDDLGKKINESSHAVIIEKVRNLEQDYGLMHQWKNVMLPAQFERQNENFTNLMKEIVKRLDRIEHKS